MNVASFAPLFLSSLSPLSPLPPLSLPLFVFFSENGFEEASSGWQSHGLNGGLSGSIWVLRTRLGHPFGAPKAPNYHYVEAKVQKSTNPTVARKPIIYFKIRRAYLNVYFMISLITWVKGGSCGFALPKYGPVTHPRS